MCPDFEEAQQLQQQHQDEQQYEQEQGQAREQQEHEQNMGRGGGGRGGGGWVKRPRIRGGLKLRAKQALDAASRGDFHTAQRIAKGNSRRESLN